MNQLSLLLAAARSLFVLRSTLSVSDFCRQNFYLPEKLTSRPGPVSFRDMEYLEEPLDAWGDTGLSFIDYCFATQVAKTTLLMLGMAWTIINDPGNTLWILATANQVRSFNRRRWHVFVRANECLRRLMPTDLDYFSLTEQHFDSCFVKFGSLRSISDLIETPVRRVVEDETDTAKIKIGEASASQLAGERTKTYLNALNIKAGSPGIEPSTIWDSLQRSTHKRYGVLCPQCEFRMFLDWRDKDGGYLVKWDEKARLPSGKWDLHCVRGTAHYECPQCKVHLDDSNKLSMTRKASGARWQATNSNPAPRHEGYQLGSIYSPLVTFAGMAEKWIECHQSITGLQIFINGWLGEVFRQVESEEVEFPESDYAMCQVSPAETGFVVINPDPWPLATHRLMTIDKQEGKVDPQTHIKDSPHIKVLVREWNRSTGASRLLFYGRLDNEDEGHALQIAFGIPSAAVFMDHGYDGTEVSRICAKFGWTALKGDPRHKFLWTETGGAGTRVTWKPYAPKSRVNAFVGTEAGGTKIIRLHLWSNPTIKDALHLLKTAKGPEWKLPRNIPEDYLIELKAEVKRKRFTPSTGQEVHEWVRVKDNHGRPLPNEPVDLECMQIVGTQILKIPLACLTAAPASGEQGSSPPVDTAAPE